MTHVAESAELYALGALDLQEQARVEAHVRECEQCRAALGDAEYVVAALAESLAAVEPPPLRKPAPRLPSFWLGALAGAAAVAAFLLPGWLTFSRNAQQNDLALSSVVQSHFNHVAFAPVRPGAPAGKVLFARSGGWLYVIVHHPAAGLTVRLEPRFSAARDAGALVAGGENATLFVPYPQRLPVDVVLTERGVPLARAAVVFSK